MSRLDCFILFSTALPHENPILRTLNDNFPIQLIKRYNAHEVVLSHSEQLQNTVPLLTERKAKRLLSQRFAWDLYKCDTVPVQHLMAKSSYLADIEPDILFVLVKNETPAEQMYGSGEFAHIQCSKIKACKEELRNRFNPRTPEGGRSEHHICHASDYESQVSYLLSYFGLPSIEFYSRTPNPDLNAAFHVHPFKQYRIIYPDLDHVKIRQPDGAYWSITDTPHYQFLQGNTQLYVEYTNSVRGSVDKSYHSAETFQSLIDNFDYNTKNCAIVKELSGGADCTEYYAIDGAHRLSILSHLGYSYAPVILPMLNIDLATLFRIPPAPYVILRNDDPANYQVGGDVDILTLDSAAWVTYLSSKGKQLGFEVAVYDVAEHCQVDFMLGGGLELKFDLVKAFPWCDWYAEQCLAMAEPSQGFMVPSAMGNLITRFAEFWVNRAKTQHYDYVKGFANTVNYKILDEINAVLRLNLTVEQFMALGVT